MKVIKSNNTRIDYQVTGQGDSTLLFVHGSNIDQSYWKEQVAYFSPAYQVVTLDLPGHGKSGQNRTHWSVADFAEDVIILIKELDLKNIILIGHSLGSDINLMVATSHPQEIIGFIGIDNFKNAGVSVVSDYEKQAEEIRQQLETDFAGTNQSYVEKMLLTPDTPEKVKNKVVNSYRTAYQPMAIATTPEIFGMFEVEKKLLPKLNQKLHLINVDYYPTNEDPLKSLAASGYAVKHMKGSSHYPMLENPDLLNELLQETISEIQQQNRYQPANAS